MPVGGMIDLHTHTSASDGTMSPSELVAHAAEIGLAAISITDHDTVDGLEEGQAAGDELGVIVVPGLELSTEYGGASLHLLGYFVDPDHNQLAERLLWLREQRRLRVPKMLKSLAALGCLVTEEEVRLKAANGVVGRPHVALAMVDRGHVSSTKEAFDESLDSS
ncbi:MAG: PHP domain-containing protein, partial [Candidatus Latescibacteria bacterium]|nr:PHP domain-containing protein [Candidatus Latescibacterota bacterium]